MAAFAVTAIKSKGIGHAQNNAQHSSKLHPDLMYKYHVRSANLAGNNHIEGYIWVNKAFNGNSGLTSTDNLTITVVAGT